MKKALLFALIIINMVLCTSMLEISSYAMVEVREPYKISDYRGESVFSLYLDENGSLYSVGDNSRGQLGIGNFSTMIYLMPKKIMDKVKLFHTGKDNFAIAVTQNNVVYSWGSDTYGQLGQGSDFNDDNTSNINAKCSPIEVLFSEDIVVAKLAIGKAHVLVLDANGNVWTFGSNNAGQLGRNLPINRKSVSGTPAKIDNKAFDNEEIVDIAASEYASYALTKSGKVYSFGSNDKGQLGIGNSNINFNSPSPVIIDILTDVVKISAKIDNCMALTSDNKAYIFGSNAFGQLGNGIIENNKFAAMPILINKFYDKQGNFTLNIDIADILCGGILSFLLSKDGNVYSCGYGGYGNVGYNIQKDEYIEHTQISELKVYSPIKITFYEPRDIEAELNDSSIDDGIKSALPVTDVVVDTKISKLVYSMGERTFVLANDGRMFSFGNNSYGQVCSGDLNIAFVPILSTLFRNANYDKEIPQPDYMQVPVIVLIVVGVLCLYWVISSEIKLKRTKKEQIN